MNPVDPFQTFGGNYSSRRDPTPDPRGRLRYSLTSRGEVGRTRPPNAPGVGWTEGVAYKRGRDGRLDDQLQM